MSFLSKFRPATCLARAPFQSPRFPAPVVSRSLRIASPRKVSGYGKNSSSRNIVDEDLDLDEARVREVMEDDVVNTGRPEVQRDFNTDGRPGGKMPDGSKVPNYTGPSIAEKKLDRSVNVDEADAVNFPTSDQLSNEESGEAVSDVKFQQYSQQSHAKQWEGYANNLFENPETRKSNPGDFDATQSEMNDFGSDLVGGMWSGKSKTGKSKNKKSIDRKGSSIFDEADSKKFYTTNSKNSTRYSDGDWVEDGVAEKDILSRDDIVGKVARKARKAADSVEEVAESAKEGAKEMAESAKENIKEGWDSVKQGAKKVKESVKDAAETLSTPVYEKPTFKEDLYPTSDVENARGVKLNSSPEFAAEQSGDVIGEDVNSLRKGLFNGPADMPQGVGKRAKDASGQPMETGTRDS